MAPRLSIIDPATATGKAKDLFTNIEKGLGMVPNLYKAIGNSPATLEGVLQFGAALRRSSLKALELELIAVTVAQENTCDYCLSAHTYLGKAAGASEEALRDARLGTSHDSRISALLSLSKAVVRDRGHISDEMLVTARNAGLSDAAIVEVVGAVVENILTNYLNNIALTPIDFPVVLTNDMPDMVTA